MQQQLLQPPRHKKRSGPISPEDIILAFELAKEDTRGSSRKTRNRKEKGMALEDDAAFRKKDSSHGRHSSKKTKKKKKSKSKTKKSKKKLKRKAKKQPKRKTNPQGNSSSSNNKNQAPLLRREALALMSETRLSFRGLERQLGEESEETTKPPLPKKEGTATKEPPTTKKKKDKDSSNKKQQQSSPSGKAGKRKSKKGSREKKADDPRYAPLVDEPPAAEKQAMHSSMPQLRPSPDGAKRSKESRSLSMSVVPTRNVQTPEPSTKPMRRPTPRPSPVDDERSPLKGPLVVVPSPTPPSDSNRTSPSLRSQSPRLYGSRESSLSDRNSPTFSGRSERRATLSRFPYHTVTRQDDEKTPRARRARSLLASPEDRFWPGWQSLGTDSRSSKSIVTHDSNQSSHNSYLQVEFGVDGAMSRRSPRKSRRSSTSLLNARRAMQSRMSLTARRSLEKNLSHRRNPLLMARRDALPPEVEILPRTASKTQSEPDLVAIHGNILAERRQSSSVRQPRSQSMSPTKATLSERFGKQRGSLFDSSRSAQDKDKDKDMDDKKSRRKSSRRSASPRTTDELRQSTGSSRKTPLREEIKTALNRKPVLQQSMSSLTTEESPDDSVPKIVEAEIPMPKKDRPKGRGPASADQAAQLPTREEAVKSPRLAAAAAGLDTSLGRTTPTKAKEKAEARKSPRSRKSRRESKETSVRRPESPTKRSTSKAGKTSPFDSPSLQDRPKSEPSTPMVISVPKQQPRSWHNRPPQSVSIPEPERKSWHQRTPLSVQEPERRSWHTRPPQTVSVPESDRNSRLPRPPPQTVSVPDPSRLDRPPQTVSVPEPEQRRSWHSRAAPSLSVVEPETKSWHTRQPPTLSVVEPETKSWHTGPPQSSSVIGAERRSWHTRPQRSLSVTQPSPERRILVHPSSAPSTLTVKKKVSRSQLIQDFDPDRRSIYSKDSKNRRPSPPGPSPRSTLRSVLFGLQQELYTPPEMGDHQFSQSYTLSRKQSAGHYSSRISPGGNPEVSSPSQREKQQEKGLREQRGRQQQQQQVRPTDKKLRGSGASSGGRWAGGHVSRLGSSTKASDLGKPPTTTTTSQAVVDERRRRRRRSNRSMDGQSMTTKSMSWPEIDVPTNPDTWDSVSRLTPDSSQRW